jgi:acetyl esterase/lipase
VARHDAVKSGSDTSVGSGNTLSAAVKPPISLTQLLQHAEVKDGYRLARDVEFAPDRKLAGDLYLPMQAAANSRLPAVLIVHGGAWTLGNKSFPGETDLGERLAKHGFIAFSADYRLIKDGGIYPKSIKDVRDAFGWMVQNADQLGIDKNRIGVFGASVGGMMALLAAYAPNSGNLQAQTYKNIEVKPKAAVMYAPLTDLRETELTWVIKYMDDTPWHSPELYAEASPITYVKTACPTMCIQGTDDVTVPFQQSESLVKALQAAGVEAQLVPIPKARHLPFHEEAGPVRELGFARLLEYFTKYLTP